MCDPARPAEPPQGEWYGGSWRHSGAWGYGTSWSQVPYPYTAQAEEEQNPVFGHAPFVQRSRALRSGNFEVGQQPYSLPYNWFLRED
eukprot:11143446-Lingulodinium_polyedra.AAC.1